MTMHAWTVGEVQGKPTARCGPPPMRGLRSAIIVTVLPSPIIVAAIFELLVGICECQFTEHALLMRRAVIVVAAILLAFMMVLRASVRLTHQRIRLRPKRLHLSKCISARVLLTVVEIGP